METKLCIDRRWTDLVFQRVFSDPLTYLCYLCCVSLIFNKAVLVDHSTKLMLLCLYSSRVGSSILFECSLELAGYLEQKLRTQWTAPWKVHILNAVEVVWDTVPQLGTHERSYAVQWNADELLLQSGILAKLPRPGRKTNSMLRSLLVFELSIFHLYVE